MSQSLSPAQQTQMDNRDASGQWKAKAHGDVDDTSDVLGLDDQDSGQAAYDALGEEEQRAWRAWREMTGKADETVVGPAQAADIADFKEHYLGSGESHDIMPDPDAAERAGLSATDDSLSEISDQWGEMVSSGEIEQHQDEEGTFHSFAHPNLARRLSASGTSSSDDESDDQQVVLDSVGTELSDHYFLDGNEHDVAMEHAEASIRGGEDDFEIAAEDGVRAARGYVSDHELEDIEPDFDDHTFSSQDAVRMSGLERLQSGEIYWDNERAYSSASPEGQSDSLGFEASGAFADVATDYLPDELAERVERHSGGRELSIANYADHAQREQVGERAQFVSVGLHEAERNAVIDHLDAENGEEFNGEIVDYWSAGQPRAMDETFGFVSTHKEWGRVSDAVRDRAPDAAHALETAEDLRREANRAFESDVEHMQSDEWKKDQARAREGLY